MTVSTQLKLEVPSPASYGDLQRTGLTAEDLRDGVTEHLFFTLVPDVNYVGGSRQLRRRVHPPSPPAMAGGGDSEN